ncbi:hypothetical protein [Haloarcula hispanica]|uniref:Uncharacterized protein n=1 Tax=Haloarcula hispanica (strain ATCC 33960 / DSM 4426 / JCM 8911 / NBRC 102182 / NCIMB 2187 / VKM B-1755) TaxID=634497 RepID=G0HQT4_HALHT|nr:hypothetical protein [Haloarcula hispanica]AEM58235.1 conserved hypothetical protein [Haloarcula hispanica ATCC 33960]
MTRRAVEREFERYLSQFVDETYAAFDVAAVLRGSNGSGSRVAGKLLNNSRPLERHVVRPKLQSYQQQILAQLEPVLDYAATDAAFETYADEVLARDIYWNALRDTVHGDRRDRIRESLLARQQSFGDDLAPLVAADSDDFWTAVTDAYDQERATDIVQTHFEFSVPLRENQNAFAFELTIDPGEVLGGLARALPTLDVEFTDEALRSMRRAEQQVIPSAKADVEQAYES